MKEETKYDNENTEQKSRQDTLSTDTWMMTLSRKRKALSHKALIDLAYLDEQYSLSFDKWHGHFAPKNEIHSNFCMRKKNNLKSNYGEELNLHIISSQIQFGQMLKKIHF